MSYKRALKAINLEPTDKIPSMEVIDHPGLISKMVEFDPYLDPPRAGAETYKKLDIDMTLGLPREATRLKDGETSYSEDGLVSASWGFTATSAQTRYPFNSVDEVLNFNPLEKYDMSVEEIAETLRKQYLTDQEMLNSHTLIPGFYYNTLFMWPVMEFGWELFMESAMVAPERFKILLDRFASLSIRYVSAWVSIGVEVMICHDDITMASGPVFDPRWYYQYIFPWYEAIWEPVKQAGKKLIFCSDGKLDCFIDDIVKLGADGFYVEPLCNLEYLAKRYGGEKVIIAGIDDRNLLFRSPLDIEMEVRRISKIFRDCAGYFYTVSGGIPGNIPMENIEAYLDACNKYGVRRRD